MCIRSISRALDSFASSHVMAKLANHRHRPIDADATGRTPFSRERKKLVGQSTSPLEDMAKQLLACKYKRCPNGMAHKKHQQVRQRKKQINRPANKITTRVGFQAKPNSLARCSLQQNQVSFSVSAVSCASPDASQFVA